MNYNAGEALYDAVVSALQSPCINEIIIVDNASVDNSMVGIQRLLELEPYIECIYNKDNVGFAKACNKAISKANGDYLLFLNPDCIIWPGTIEEMLRHMNINERIAIAGPYLMNMDGSEQAGGRRIVPTPWRSFVRVFGLSRFSDRYPRLFSGYQLNHEPLPEHYMEVEAISGSCMLVKSSVLKEVGLMDEGYFLHCEDLDWFMRFRQKGWKIIFVPSAKVMHHKGVCSRARPIFVEWHKHKGMMRFYRKFFYKQYPSVLMWLVAIGVSLRFCMIAVSSGFSCIRDRFLGRR